MIWMWVLEIVIGPNTTPKTSLWGEIALTYKHMFMPSFYLMWESLTVKKHTHLRLRHKWVSLDFSL